jgi:hypothetical protein
MQMADPLSVQGSPSTVAARTPVSQEESNERQVEAEDSRAGDNLRVRQEERKASQLSSIGYDKVNEAEDTERKS